MSDSRFIKNKENFICLNCGYKIIGSGYTNHCPKCLFSRHVDIYPGDRAATCLGLMKPIKIRKNRADYDILHQCAKCGHKKWNKIQKEDDFDKIINI